MGYYLQNRKDRILWELRAEAALESENRLAGSDVRLSVRPFPGHRQTHLGDDFF